MKGIINKFTLFIVVVLLSSCIENRHNTVEREIDAIYWHEGSRYTAVTIDDGGMITRHNIPSCGVHTATVV